MTKASAHRRLLLLSAVAATAISGSAAAQSQSGEAAAPAAGAPSATIGEVIVTARRRAERLQDVPVAVTALSGAQLAERGVVKLEDLRNQSPSFQVQPGPYGSAVPAFQVRGQRQQEALITQDPSVGVYVDEVYQARVYGVNQSMLDLANAQVLKGPQGTLFGRNTTGGAVLLQSQRPTDQFEGRVTAGVGNYSQHEVSAVINVPVSENLRLRAAVASNRHDGYTRNVNTGERLGTENNFAYRLGVLFTSGPLDTYTTFSGTRTTGSGVPLISQGWGPPAFVNPNVDPAAVNASLARQATLGFHEMAGDEIPYPGEVKSDAITNVSTFELAPGLTLKNIAGYRRVDAKIGVEFDGSDLKARNGLPFFNALNQEHQRQFSEEIQLQGKALDQRLTYVVGAYYFQEKGSDFQQTIIGPANISQSSGGRARNESKSVFGQIDVELFDGLTATAGGRYSWDNRDLTGATALTGLVGVRTPFIDYNGQPAPLVCLTGAPLPTCEAVLPTYKDHRPTWNLGLKWKPISQAMLYGTVSRGYRSGGYNLRGKLTGIGPYGSFGPFRPEIVTSYEVGAKFDWTAYGMPGRLNLAAYHQKYNNIQRTIFAFFPGETVAAAYILNAASAKIDGVEGEFAITPLEGLEISTYASYTRPKYTRFSYQVAANPNGTGTRTVDASSFPFAGTPKYQAGANVRYSTPLAGDLGRVVASVQYNYQSRYYWSDSGERAATTGAYGLVSGRLEWANIAGHNLDLAIWGRNLGNKHYKGLGASGFNTLGFISYIPGDPRTYGATLTARF